MLATMLNRRQALMFPAVLPLVGRAEESDRADLRERLRERMQAGHGDRRPQRSLPQPTDLRWTDASRDRQLPLRLRMPREDGPVPLVLFSHGLGGNLDAGTLWGQAWAQAGMATLHVQHPGSDTEVLRSQGLQGLRQAATATQLGERAQDVRFVLDELQRRAAEFPRLRLDAIGVAGHSFGAHTTLAVAGQTYGPSAAAPFTDPRPRAFAAFSPAPAAHSTSALAGFATIDRPVLCLTGSLDTDPLAPSGSDRSQSGRFRRQVFDALPSGRKAELWLQHADHMSFSGQVWPDASPRRVRRNPDSERLAAHHQALIATASTDWWRAHLLDDSAARERLAQPPQALGPSDQWRTS